MRIICLQTAPVLLMFFTLCLAVWGVEPDETHQTSWLGSTGECGVLHTQAGENSAQRGALSPASGGVD